MARLWNSLKNPFSVKQEPFDDSQGRSFSSDGHMMDVQAQESAMHSSVSVKSSTRHGTVIAQYSSITNNHFLLNLTGDRVDSGGHNDPSGDDRCGVDIAVVIDISGSMTRTATIAGKEYAMTLLDIVKHAAKTVVGSLDERDRLTILTFSDCAEVVFGPKNMTAHEKTVAMNKITAIQTAGRTNLWDGIMRGMHAVSQKKDGLLPFVILLTDGEPNVHPAGGEVHQLNRMLKEMNYEDIHLMTMALGFDTLASELLLELSGIAKGAYSYIADAGMVGTTFVNLMSSIKAMAVHSVLVTVTDDQGNPLAITPLVPYQKCLDNQITVPMIQTGQTHAILLRCDADFSGNLTVQVTFESEIRSKKRQLADVCVKMSPDAGTFRDQFTRSQYLQLLRSCIENNGLAENEIKAELASIKRDNPSTSLELQAMHKDLIGEVIAANQPEFKSKWGMHYMRSLFSAHLNQLVDNFRNHSVQTYATALFKIYQLQGDAMFAKIPPPDQTAVRGEKVHSMEALNTHDNPCMHGDTVVHMADGTFKATRNVKRGDRVFTGTVTPSNGDSDGDGDGKGGGYNRKVADTGSVAVVTCVIETRCPTGTAELVTMPGTGLRITPYHPIFLDGKWQFPSSIAEPSVQKCDAVFSFVLVYEHDKTQQAPSMLINNIPCISLGHGIMNDPVAAHEYFSEYILGDLQNMRAWDSGRIVFSSKCMVRRCIGSQVCGIATWLAVPSDQGIVAANKRQEVNWADLF